jgi:hypothetical protein
MENYILVKKLNLLANLVLGAFCLPAYLSWLFNIEMFGSPNM